MLTIIGRERGSVVVLRFSLCCVRLKTTSSARKFPPFSFFPVSLLLERHLHIGTTILYHVRGTRNTKYNGGSLFKRQEKQLSSLLFKKGSGKWSKRQAKVERQWRGGNFHHWRCNFKIVPLLRERERERDRSWTLSKRKRKKEIFFFHANTYYSAGRELPSEGELPRAIHHRTPPPSPYIVKIARGFIARGTEPTDTREALFIPSPSLLAPQSVRWRMVLTYAAVPVRWIYRFFGRRTLEKMPSKMAPRRGKGIRR